MKKKIGHLRVGLAHKGFCTIGSIVKVVGIDNYINNCTFLREKRLLTFRHRKETLILGVMHQHQNRTQVSRLQFLVQ